MNLSPRRDIGTSSTLMNVCYVELVKPLGLGNTRLSRKIPQSVMTIVKMPATVTLCKEVLHVR